MNEYGIKIKNIEAGSLYAVNNGVRENLDCKDAMFTNSLFCDYLLEHGLNVWKGKSTRDIICLDFKYGTRSYAEELDHLNKQIDNLKKDESIPEEIKESRLNFFDTQLAKAMSLKDKFVKVDKNDIRTEYYKNGCTITWKTYNRKGGVIDTETIKYRMLNRSAGKAKKGSVMMIREELYQDAINFLYMGIQLPKHDAPLVEIGAYNPLVGSTIVGRVKINPHNILILDDVDAFFKTKVVSVEIDKKHHCFARDIDDYELKNTLFDGQALIDHSLMPSWGNGYILLRQHFFKAAAFDCNLQQFFKDYYGKTYEVARVKDCFGVEHNVRDIQLVSTVNACKWLKFDVSYDYWCNIVAQNGNLFGIVKTAHASKYGEVQKMSYQMVNSLDLNLMQEISQTSVDYVWKLKSDTETFLQYLRDNQNYCNDYEVLLALVDQDKDFIRSSYFRERKTEIIRQYFNMVKTGKLIQNAENLTIVGSPYAMLLHTVGENPLKDPTFDHEDGCIQCYTERFEDGEYLAEFRNPFNSRNNLGYMHNHLHPLIKKYFNLGKLCIAVNMIGTDFQDRNNGSDQDSDSCYTTNVECIVDCARRFYKEYPTVVNNIPKSKKHYEATDYETTMENFAIIDNNLAEAQRAIGESANLAQICLTYTYNADKFENANKKKYEDFCCVLAVLSQVAIDNAKRAFDISLPDEIARLRTEMELSINGFPSFWRLIRPGFNVKKVNKELICPMNYMEHIQIPTYRPSESTIPIEKFFVNFTEDVNRRKCKKVEDLIAKYSLDLYKFNMMGDSHDTSEELLLRADFDNLIEDIRSTYISKNYQGLMSWLINRAFCMTQGIKNAKGSMNSTIHRNKTLLLKVLYQVNKDAFLKCFAGNV